MWEAGAGKEGRELQVGQSLQGEAWGGTKMIFIHGLRMALPENFWCFGNEENEGNCRVGNEALGKGLGAP